MLSWDEEVRSLPRSRNANAVAASVAERDTATANEIAAGRVRSSVPGGTRIVETIAARMDLHEIHRDVAMFRLY